MSDFTLHDDILDVRDLIERFEELRDAKDVFVDTITEWREELNEAKTKKDKKAILKKIEDFGEWHETDGGEEFIQLEKILDELRGNGGDEKWEGDWYPVTLIHERYFTEYIKDLLDDCGYIPKDLPSWITIDWEDTADNCKVDYITIDIDSENTYYYR